jgi:hypothetical protein
MQKIYGERTRPTDAPSLCLTCNGAMVVRGTRLGDDRIVCRFGLGPVRFVVTECSGYSDNRLIDVSAYHETAWRWFDNRFVSPAELMHLNQVTPSSPPARTQGE